MVFVGTRPKDPQGDLNFQRFALWLSLLYISHYLVVFGGANEGLRM